MTIATATVSARARPSARIVAPKMPARAAGRTTCQIVSHQVAPSATVDSRSPRGTARMTSLDTAASVGRIITASTSDAVNRLVCRGTPPRNGNAARWSVIGVSMCSANALVTTVPKMKGSAPKVFVTWFQSWPIRKPIPNLVTEGHACWIKTATMRISDAGAAQLMNAMTVRYRSGGRGTTGATEIAELSTATANVTPSRWGGNSFGCPDDQVGRRRLPVEPVADPSHGHDLEWGPRSELLAQPPDMHVDRLAVACELAAPHVL